jgi:hypothetical protein
MESVNLVAILAKLPLEDRVRRVGRGGRDDKTEASRHTKDMSIDRQCRHPQTEQQDTRCRFRTDPLEFDEFRSGRGNRQCR